MKTKNIIYLFKYIGSKWHIRNGKSIRNHAKVFLVKTEGIPKPKHEIKYIAFWKPQSNIHITVGTKKVIEKYLSEYKQ